MITFPLNKTHIYMFIYYLADRALHHKKGSYYTCRYLPGYNFGKYPLIIGKKFKYRTKTNILRAYLTIVT